MKRSKIRRQNEHGVIFKLLSDLGPLTSDL